MDMMSMDLDQIHEIANAPHDYLRGTLIRALREALRRHEERTVAWKRQAATIVRQQQALGEIGRILDEEKEV